MKSLLQKTIISVLILATIAPTLQAQGWKDWFIATKPWGIGVGICGAAALWGSISWYAINNKLKKLQKKKDEWKKVQEKTEQIKADIDRKEKIKIEDPIKTLKIYLNSIRDRLGKNSPYYVITGFGYEASDENIPRVIANHLNLLCYDKTKDFIANFSKYNNAQNSSDLKYALEASIADVEKFLGSFKPKEPATFSDDEIDIMRQNEVYNTTKTADGQDKYSRINKNIPGFMKKKYSLIQQRDFHSIRMSGIQDNIIGIKFFTGLSAVATAIAVYQSFQANKVVAN